MPLYDYQCPICKEVTQLQNSIANHEEGGECCGEKRKQIILSAPMVEASFLGSYKNPGYWCPVSEQFVDSKRQRQNIMAEHNVVPKE